uniref:Uncharacterized protein n=1 Tax=Hyaloperonospora arabidopsidis (strain Emoy2) TaxID=559515 RepID=M4BYU3_HYAAE
MVRVCVQDHSVLPETPDPVPTDSGNQVTPTKMKSPIVVIWAGIRNTPRPRRSQDSMRRLLVQYIPLGAELEVPKMLQHKAVCDGRQSLD